MKCIYEPEFIATVYRVINVHSQPIKIGYSCSLIMDYAHDCTDNFVYIFRILSYIDQLKKLLCKYLSWLFHTVAPMLVQLPDYLENLNMVSYWYSVEIFILKIRLHCGYLIFVMDPHTCNTTFLYWNGDLVAL